MRHYTEDALRIIHQNTETVDVAGVPVVVKPSPNEPRKGYADLSLWEEIQNSPWARNAGEKQGPPPAPAEFAEMMRANMGGFNENINSVEIHTRFEELDASGNAVGLWRYYTRRSEKRTDRPALVHFHGGGWIGGSVYVVENFCRYMAELTDAVVFSVDYSLAPEKPYPNGLNDNYSALCHIATHAAEYGIDPNRIAVSGDSAGGNYAAAVSLMARDKGFPKLALQVLIYPALLRGDKLPEGYVWKESMLGASQEQFDTLRPLMQLGRPMPIRDDFGFQLYAGVDCDTNDPYISPMLAPSHGELPRALLFAGEFDGLRIQTEFYASLLQKAGVPVRCIRYRGLAHAFIDKIGFCPQTEDMCREIAAAMQDR